MVGAPIRVRVRARADRGRWRCGLFWPKSWTEANVTQAQLEQLQADKVLVVHIAATSNDSVPDVADVQPGAIDPPAPVPWDDPKLERLRAEAAELDEQTAKEALEIRGEINTEESEQDDPNVQRVSFDEQRRHQNKKRR